MKTSPLALHLPDPSIIIRPAELADLNILMQHCWQDRKREVCLWLLTRAVRNHERKRGIGIAVLDRQQQPVAYGQMTLWPRCGEISDLIVNENYRNRGYGTAMIQYLVREAKYLKAACVEIGAAESNLHAMSLYHRLGFVDDRTIYMNLGGTEREPVIYMRLRIS